MFTRLRPLYYYISEKVIVRSLRNSRISGPGPNPGLSRRIRAFQEDGLELRDDDAEEFIERSESDFKNVGEVYNEHLNETLIGKYELRHQIVKDKYFKENMPNLLTWSEKEQIKHLAATAPDEWTPEKIAESFPVTAFTVKKILKYPWKPATKERIARHDASVMRNWRELKEGSLSISEDMRQHFLKFSNRTIPPLSTKSFKIDVTPEENIGEFEQIVKRCAEKENTKYNEVNTNHETEDKEYTKFEQIKDKKLMTLDQLKEKIKKQLDSGNGVNINDEIIVNTIDSNAPNTNSAKLNNELELYDIKGNATELTELKESKENNIMDYPERIRIPKKAYKRGATYKVNDCYYDHDGKFLYRVLGMSNN